MLASFISYFALNLSRITHASRPCDLFRSHPDLCHELMMSKNDFSIVFYQHRLNTLTVLDRNRTTAGLVNIPFKKHLYTHTNSVTTLKNKYINKNWHIIAKLIVEAKYVNKMTHILRKRYTTTTKSEYQSLTMTSKSPLPLRYSTIIKNRNVHYKSRTHRLTTTLVKLLF